MFQVVFSLVFLVSPSAPQSFRQQLQGWGQWTQWGPCSASCGPGSKVRTKKCVGSRCGTSGFHTEEKQERICIAPDCNHPADAVSIDFDAFKKKYMKVYSNDSEEAFRYAHWKNKTDLIKEHNKLYLAGNTTYRQAENEFITLTYEEFKASYLGLLKLPKISTTYRPATVDTETLPSSVDWRTKGYVTPVKHQGGCGSCWAFSATGAMEGAHFKEFKTLVSLSESNLVDCSGPEGNQGCNGGWPTRAFQYVLNNKGIGTEASYPYVPKDQPCKFDANNIGTTITGWKSSGGSEADLQNSMATIGPVSVAICADANFHHYKSGIFYADKCMESSQCNGSPNHAVLVVGYGSNADGDYWIVKNSWGPGWGLGGYIWMARNKDNNCDIASYAVYPFAQGPCCDILEVVIDKVDVIANANGRYTKMKTMHNGHSYYVNRDGTWCVFFADHWKLDACTFVTSGQNWSQGYGWSKINTECPGDIGPNWRYYSWKGGSDSGPVDTSIVINC